VKRFMKSVNCSKPGYITCSQNSNIPYNLIFTTKFNDSSILITIISSAVDTENMMKLFARFVYIKIIYCNLIGWSAWRKNWLYLITWVGIGMSPTYSFANDKFKYSHEIIVMRISQSDCSKLFLYIQTLQIISSYSLYLLHYNILLNYFNCVA
jgi:hypothetical protein